MKTLLAAAIILFAAFVAVDAQFMPVITNERGDTIPYTFPPPPNSYVPNELIIRFRPEALNLNLLCYGYLPQA